MSYPVFYAFAGDTIPIPFGSYDGATGASEAASGLAVTDIEIYKAGGTTQRASDNGYALLDTDGLDFDSITGLNGFSVDLSDNSDAGFYTAGSWYWVIVSSVTVDTQTVNFIAALVYILPTERGFTGTALPAAAAAANGGLPTVDANNRVAGIQGTITTLDALDTAQDSQHSTTQGKVDTAQADLDTLTGPDGVTLATSQPNYAPATAAGLATAQADLDTITGPDGVTLATAQGNYAPAKVGDQVDLVNAPNATAVTAIQSGLATAAALVTVDSVVDAIKLVTDNLPESGALTTLLANVAAILADTGTDGVVVASGSKSGYTLGTDGLPAAAVAAAAAAKIADILIRRSNASIEASSDGDALALKSLYGLIAVFTNGFDALTTPGTMSVKKAGGTELGTLPLTGDSGADPVVKSV